MPPLNFLSARHLSGAELCVPIPNGVHLFGKQGTACLRRGIRCERWVQALALPDQDALYNATFYFPALDVRPLPVQSLFWRSTRSHSATPPSTSRA